MHIVCLDLEGVLVPEIWIAVAERARIDELKLTTRDIPDYDELMRRRIEVLHRNDLRLADIRGIIEDLAPLEGAREFLDELRERTQVVILSDTFVEFAAPLMRKLARPTLFCNSLVVSEDGRIEGYRLRQRDGKRTAVEALQTIGFRVAAAGDSYNDISMLTQSDLGILFRAPEAIVQEFGSFTSVTEHRELLDELERGLIATAPERGRRR
jgi:phosphoserine / homoserine phosphotransferase